MKWRPVPRTRLPAGVIMALIAWRKLADVLRPEARRLIGKFVNKTEETLMCKGLFAATAAAAFAAAGVLLAGYSLSGDAALAQQPIIIKFSHVVSPDAPKGKAAILFRD